MDKEKTKEDYKDDIKNLQRKQMQLVVDADKLAKELQEATEKYYELSDEYVKITCLTCGGEGIIKNQETGKRELCKNEMLPQLACHGKKFIWMKKYEGD